MKLNLDYQGNVMVYIALMSLPFDLCIPSYLPFAYVFGVDKLNCNEILKIGLIT